MMRHCPDSGVINTHYNYGGDKDLNITNSDYVCTSCYNTHLDIVHWRQSISRDDDLKEILADINNRLPLLNLGVHTCIALEGVKKCITKLGDILKNKLAILMPDLYRFFF